MPAVAEAPAAALATDQLAINPSLLNAVIAAAGKGLAMCGVEARCVGASRVPGRQHGQVTGMIGVHGSVSGFVTVNLSDKMAMHAVSGLLGEPCTALTEEVIDGAGEVTNIIVGGVKSALSKGEWAFSQITVPSVIVGDGYQVAFAPGLEVLDVTFEIPNSGMVLTTDRLVHVSLSLLKL